MSSIVTSPVSGSDGAIPSATWRAKPMEPGSGNPVTRAWLLEQVAEGDRINRDDPSYGLVDKSQRFIAGDQRSARDMVEDNLTYLPRTRFNESRKAVQAHVAALTDLKAVFQFTSANPQFKFHGELITKRVIYWYNQQMADLVLSDVITNALATGTGDCVVEYDPYAPGGGDTVLSARDFRDTLPFRPGTNKDPQMWQGLTLREEHPVNVLRAMYPTKAALFRPTVDSLLASYMGKFRTTVQRIVSPTGGTLGGLRDASHSQIPRSGSCLLYRTYLRDYTTNLTGAPVSMGTPGTAWSYVVEPGDPLYPYGRLIVWTPDLIVYDGPNTYLHGQHPVVRYQPWQVPWQFLGIPLLYDTMPINEAINGVAADILLTFKKNVNPQVAYDRNQVSETFMQLYDPRKPGAKIKQNNSSGETGFRYIDTPQLPTWMLAFWESLFAKHESLTGTANLQQLLQARQLPSGDSIQKYFEALTPEIRMEGRRFEAFLRPLAEMLKINIFQFESTARRLTILGEPGIALSDFDFDPGQLVPGMSPRDTQGVEDPKYLPEFDASLPRHLRAQAMWKLLTFTISPHSLLSINNAEQKMIRLQLARMGYYDFWSLMESLEVPNIGTPPSIPLPPLEEPNPEEVMADIAKQMGSPGGVDPATGQVLPAVPPQPGKYTIGPMGEVLELRVPQTVTERLAAQQMLGIGMTENPAGRKASGGSEPKQETKTDETGAPRQTVTESSGSKNA
jgi:hypothetical protein